MLPPLLFGVGDDRAAAARPPQIPAAPPIATGLYPNVLISLPYNVAIVSGTWRWVLRAAPCRLAFETPTYQRRSVRFALVVVVSLLIGYARDFTSRLGCAPVISPLTAPMKMSLSASGRRQCSPKCATVRRCRVSLAINHVHCIHICEHPQSGVVYDFGRVSLSVCLSVRR